MRSSVLGSLLAVAALGMGMAPGGLGVGQPARVVAVAGVPRAERRQMRGVTSDDVSVYRRKTGWTNARYQRAARKARNQRKNRSAHRG